MDSPRPESPAAPALLGMVGAWVGVFAGAAVTALVWKYPLLMVGNEGGSLDAALVALLTVLLWLVLASMGLGLVVAAGVIAVLVG
ncbi:hypothetical protein GOHSU_16_00840 [Gordonia hirsuta DSM 44140 = NBRC 16056]|uniref:Uncharacterized protein n=1 Tax=Gordonia hirsuta DSM 44140 = NBRC 16056 TaxID=1121927 RepID=L7L8Q4_9ACTN|nr:hypothetical protein [Gordonia hirsuta]GAC57126.1 hypothetical protein GOHSU_16_00840 [Gordonia hirsuta DSM 44140 = NBRC 16056]